jgi:UDP-N-acetylmuramoyl-tripeptide--D-alanyl-D-alanine ligase
MKGVRELRPEWIAALTSGILHAEVKPADDLVWDSRMVKPGAAFVALPGERVHGREFGALALSGGAAFVLTDQAHSGAIQVERPEHALLEIGRALRAEFKGSLIGVGGSAGKTTAKEAIAQGLGWAAPEGNLNNAPGLSRFFVHLASDAPGAVVELGIDRLGEMAELVYLSQPDLGVLTTLGVEHLDGLGGFEQVIAEEAVLLEATRIRLASTQAAAFLSLSKVQTYGLGEGDFRGTNLQMESNRSQFSYRGYSVHLPYPGLGPALGAVAALACAELMGVALDGVIERLSKLALPSGRMERIELGGIVFINDAYNSSPVAVEAGLKFLKQQTGTKWIVLGEMLELGEESLTHHLAVARHAAQVSKDLIFVGRFAQAQAAEAGGWVAKDVEEARTMLQQYVQPGDLVYLKASRGIRFEGILQRWGQA